MTQTILTLCIVGVVIYALVDCWRSRPDEVQRLSRVAWAVIILALPPVGALAFLTLGRAPSPTSGLLTGPRLTAPDDDPEFLRALELKRRQTLVEERRRREADEKRRKAERKEQHRTERKADKTDRADAAQPATPQPAAQQPAAPQPTAPQPVQDDAVPGSEPEPDERPDPSDA